MKLSEFAFAIESEFGDFGRILLRDLVLTKLGNRTGDEALAAGIPPREVWLALCDAQDVPAERRHGVGLPKPRD